MAAYQQYTRAQLRAQLEVRYENAPYWSTNDADRAINQALRVWNSVVGFWRATVTVTALSGDHTVALPGSLLYRTRVALADGTPIPIVSQFELNRVQPNWRYEFVNSGGSVPTAIAVCAPIGLQTLRVWPAAAPPRPINIPPPGGGGAGAKPDHPPARGGGGRGDAGPHRRRAVRGLGRRGSGPAARRVPPHRELQARRRALRQDAPAAPAVPRGGRAAQHAAPSEQGLPALRGARPLARPP